MTLENGSTWLYNTASPNSTTSPNNASSQGSQSTVIPSIPPSIPFTPSFIPFIPSFIPDGFYLGYSAFTTFVWPQSKTCWVRASLKRLQHNAASLHLAKENLPSLEACMAFLETLAQQETSLRAQPWVFRLTVVAHPAPLAAFFKQTEALPALCLLSLRQPAEALPSQPPSPLQATVGLTLYSAAYSHPLAHIKHGSLAGSLHWRKTLASSSSLSSSGLVPHLAASPEEVIWLSPEGCFTEATTSNVLWFVKQKNTEVLALRGANPLQALAGTTRQQVKQSAASLGVPWQEEALPQKELPSVLGGFLLNATQGLRPIAIVDGHTLPWPEEALLLWGKLYTHWRENHIHW